MDNIKDFIRVSLCVVLYYGTFVSCDHNDDDRDRYGRDICSDYDRPGMYSYCEDGYYCCENNTKCCTSGVSTAAVIGIVLACLFLVGICMICSILLAKKKKLRPNQLVYPNNSRISTINQQNIYTSNNINTRGQSQNHLPPSYSYGLAPPQYDQSNFQHTPYSYSTPHGVQPAGPPPIPPPYSQTDQAAPPAYKLEP